MATINYNDVIYKLRRDTAANWSLTNPVLADGEIGIETNTKKVKIGNGTSTWNSLSYFRQSFTATLTAAGWTGSAAPFTQTVTITGILASMRVTTSVVLSTTPATALSEVDAFSLVHRVTLNDGNIVATCYGEKPTINLNIRIEEV